LISDSRFTTTRSYVQAQELLRKRNEHLWINILISKALGFNAHQILREFPRPDMRSDKAFNFRNVGCELIWPCVGVDWIPIAPKDVSDPPSALRCLFVHGSHEAA